MKFFEKFNRNYINHDFYLILVCFGAPPKNKLEVINKFCVGLGFKPLLVIRTDKKEHNFSFNPNECAEFSGYQLGLKIITDKYIYSKSREFSIFFINDTIFSSHLTLLLKFFIRSYNYFLSNSLFYSKPALIGIKRYFQDSFIPIFGKYYFSTWVFIMKGKYDDLSNFKFYQCDEVISKFHLNIWPKIDMKYKKHIDDWINPKSFLKGWYKGSTILRQSTSVYNRKILTIYLEHSMPLRAKHLNFNFYDIGSFLPFYFKIYYQVLLIMDRILNNYLKIKHRLSVNINQIFIL